MKPPQIQIWFLGRLCNVQVGWQPAEYDDEGYLIAHSFWMIKDLIDVETGFPIHCICQGSFNGQEYDPEFETILEDHQVYNAVEATFIQAFESQFFFTRHADCDNPYCNKGHF